MSSNTAVARGLNPGAYQQQIGQPNAASGLLQLEVATDGYQRLSGHASSPARPAPAKPPSLVRRVAKWYWHLGGFQKAAVAAAAGVVAGLAGYGAVKLGIMAVAAVGGPVALGFAAGVGAMFVTGLFILALFGQFNKAYHAMREEERLEALDRSDLERGRTGYGPPSNATVSLAAPCSCADGRAQPTDGSPGAGVPVYDASAGQPVVGLGQAIAAGAPAPQGGEGTGSAQQPASNPLVAASTFRPNS